MIAALDSQVWDVVLADAVMPHFSGLRALQLLRTRYPDLPFILVSGQIDDETAVTLMRDGAQDYIMKSNLHRLVPAIKRELIEAENKRARRAAEEQLLNSEALFRTLTTISQVGIFMCSLTAETIYLNARGCEILGLPIEEVQGNGWMRTLHPDEKASFERGLSAAMNACLPYESEHRILKKDGQCRWVLTQMTGAQDSEGRTTSYVGTMTDITELKRQQEDLLRLNRALSTLSKCNEVVIRSENEHELLKEVCQMLARFGDYSLSCDLTDSCDLITSNFSSLPDIGVNVSDGNGHSSKSMRSDTSESSDASVTATQIGFLEGERPSLILRPFHDGSKREFKICKNDTDPFTDHEICLLEELAADVAFGIENLKLRDECNRAQLNSLEHQNKLQESLEDALQALAATLELRDPYTAGHQLRVAELAKAIAKELGLPEQQIHSIHLASVVHDVGKIHIPAEILAKPGKLSNIEFELIKTHAQAGYDILKGVKFPWPIAEIVWQHHERLDGSGYPRGLRGSDILLEAKIVSVADVVEAMSSHRPYRAGLGIDVALDAIVSGRGTLYEPSAVDACVKLFREKHFEFLQVNFLQ